MIPTDRASSHRRPRIAIVTHNIHVRGGTRSQTGFAAEVLERSGRFDFEIVTLATSAFDDCSVLLSRPSTWTRGIRADRRAQQGLPTTHVGCLFSELEFQRYKPRARLDGILSRFDALLVIAGAPTWGHAVLRARKPVVLWAATAFRADRTSRLRDERGFRRLVMATMTRLCAGYERRALSRVDRVLAISEYSRGLFAPYVPAGRLALCFIGVDERRFDATPPNPAGPILAVGRLSDPRKNVNLLFRSYASLVARLGERAPRLLLVGGRPDSRQMELASALGLDSRLDVLENVGPEALASAYRECSIFALSSDEEGLGIVVLEAMASGRPVVATRCGGPESVVRHGETGLLTPVGDAPALASAMAALVDDPALAARMGRAARADVETRFSLGAAGTPVIEALESVLRPTGRHGGMEALPAGCDIEGPAKRGEVTG